MQLENRMLTGPVVKEPLAYLVSQRGMVCNLVVVSEMVCAQVLLANPMGYT